jgi:hypothetical protein
MAGKDPKKNAPNALDYVCGYCLFFQPQSVASGASRAGNCAHHKQWIENAYRTTCSEMSNQTLEGQGIYRLVSDNDAGWQYIRRTEKLRTRLFLVK